MLGKISPWAYVMGCQGTSPGLTLELRPARTGGLLPTVSARWEVMCVHGPWKTPPTPDSASGQAWARSRGSRPDLPLDSPGGLSRAFVCGLGDPSHRARLENPGAGGEMLVPENTTPPIS